MGKKAQFQGLVEVRPATLGHRLEASGLTWKVKSAAGSPALGRFRLGVRRDLEGSVVCLHLWTCHQSFSDTPGVAQAGDQGTVILLGPATNPSSFYQLIFPVPSPVRGFG